MAKTDKKQNRDLVITQSIFEQIKEIDENGTIDMLFSKIMAIKDYMGAWMPEVFITAKD